MASPQTSTPKQSTAQIISIDSYRRKKWRNFLF
jgi:hypothetical protein